MRRRGRKNEQNEVVEEEEEEEQEDKEEGESLVNVLRLKKEVNSSGFEKSQI